VTVATGSITTGDGPLSPYRVLDLTDETGYLCGRILGDLGADVIKVEPPGGDRARRHGPFAQDLPDPERSLFFWAYNVNKRGVTLALDRADGRAVFRRLVAKSDFVVDSSRPGYLDHVGLGYEELSRINPRIILIAISAFGPTGPYHDWKATDIVGLAMGGMLGLSGDPDRPPVRLGVPQAWHQAAAEATAGALVAHYVRETTGEGQRVDVSMQQSVVWTILTAAGHALPDFDGVDLERCGTHRSRGQLVFRQIYPCQDGHVTFQLVAGPPGAASMRALIDLMSDAGMAADWLKTKDWKSWNFAALSRMGAAGQAEVQAIEDAFARFFLTKSVGELYRAAVDRGILLAPVSTMADVLHDPQLEARGFWKSVEHPDLGRSVTYPGPFAQGSAQPARIRRRPPRVGEHNREVYGDLLGLSDDEIERLYQVGAI
jgi:benzylsuccinate CoA-transferase BbsE subunit